MMTRKVRILASGSSGNCTFVRFGETRILIDAGISLRRIRAGVEGAGESLDDISAVIVTHEHSDHVSSLATLLKHHPDLPVLATRGTSRALKLDGFDTRRIEAGKAKQWESVDIVPFPVSHDAAEPVGLRFEAGQFALGLATDLGFWTDEVADALRGCPFLIVEANHDPEMLRGGPYPQFLKRRVSGRRGHLANSQARTLLDEIAGPCIETVVLGHVSETNNTAELAAAAATDVFGEDVAVLVASRRPGPVVEPIGKAVFEGPPRQLALW